MKQRALALIHGLRPSLRSGKRWLVLLLLAVVLAPPSARAAGIGDILTLFKTITSTIQGVIGGALSGIQTLNSTINNFRQQIIWPLAQINQARVFVASTMAQYGGLMSQIHAIKNNSATLTNPTQLESVFRNGQSGSIGQFQPFYINVYGSSPFTSMSMAMSLPPTMPSQCSATWSTWTMHWRRGRSRLRSFRTRPHRECWRKPIPSSNRARQRLPAQRLCSRLRPEFPNWSHRRI